MSSSGTSIRLRHRRCTSEVPVPVRALCDQAPRGSPGRHERARRIDLGTESSRPQPASSVVPVPVPRTASVVAWWCALFCEERTAHRAAAQEESKRAPPPFHSTRSHPQPTSNPKPPTNPNPNPFIHIHTPTLLQCFALVPSGRMSRPTLLPRRSRSSMVREPLALSLSLSRSSVGLYQPTALVRNNAL